MSSGRRSARPAIGSGRRRPDASGSPRRIALEVRRPRREPSPTISTGAVSQLDPRRRARGRGRWRADRPGTRRRPGGRRAVTSVAPRRTAAAAASNAVLPPPMTATRRPAGDRTADRRSHWPISVERVDDARRGPRRGCRAAWRGPGRWPRRPRRARRASSAGSTSRPTSRRARGGRRPARLRPRRSRPISRGRRHGTIPWSPRPPARGVGVVDGHGDARRRSSAAQARPAGPAPTIGDAAPRRTARA